MFNQSNDIDMLNVEKIWSSPKTCCKVKLLWFCYCLLGKFNMMKFSFSVNISLAAYFPLSAAIFEL